LSQKAHIQRLASGLTGCINIDTNLQPTDPSIKPTVRGEDCTAIILGLGFGTNTVEQAMDKGRISRNPERPERPEPMAVKRIRSITLHDWQFLMVGERCVIVTGEP